MLRGRSFWLRLHGGAEPKMPFKTECHLCGEAIVGVSRENVKHCLAVHIRDQCLGGRA